MIDIIKYAACDIFGNQLFHAMNWGVILVHCISAIELAIYLSFWLINKLTSTFKMTCGVACKM